MKSIEITKDATLGFYNDTGILNIPVKQFDNARKIRIMLIDDSGKEYIIPDGAEINFKALKPDGKQINTSEVLEISENRIVLSVNEQMTIVDGVVKCEIILHTNGNRITTSKFNLIVESSVHDNSHLEESTDYNDILDAMEDVNLLIERYEKAKNDIADFQKTLETNESERISNEKIRQNQETKRESKTQEAIDKANMATQNANDATDHCTTVTYQLGDALEKGELKAQKYYLLAESHSHGGTGIRDGEDTDNAKKYYEQAKAISESFSGALKPMGTVTFADLPTLSDTEAGDMYNISTIFTTTADFKEGIGHTIPAGANVYKTMDGKWDVLAGTPVSSVNGETGNVLITPESIGSPAKDEVVMKDELTAANTTAADTQGLIGTASAGSNVQALLDAAGENINKIQRSACLIVNSSNPKTEQEIINWITGNLTSGVRRLRLYNDYNTALFGETGQFNILIFGDSPDLNTGFAVNHWSGTLFAITYLSGALSAKRLAMNGEVWNIAPYNVKYVWESDFEEYAPGNDPENCPNYMFAHVREFGGVLGYWANIFCIRREGKWTSQFAVGITGRTAARYYNPEQNAWSVWTINATTNDVSDLQNQINGKQNSLGFTPVQQGGGSGQSANKVYIGWTGSELNAQVDWTNLGGIAFKSDITSLRNSFQAGCNKIAAAVAAYGPKISAGSSPDQIVNAINRMGYNDFGAFWGALDLVINYTGGGWGTLGAQKIYCIPAGSSLTVTTVGTNNPENKFLFADAYGNSAVINGVSYSYVTYSVHSFKQSNIIASQGRNIGQGKNTNTFTLTTNGKGILVGSSSHKGANNKWESSFWIVISY